VDGISGSPEESVATPARSTLPSRDQSHPAAAAWCAGPEAFVSNPSSVPEETVFWGTGQRWFTLGAECRMAHDQESTSPTPFVTQYASLLNPNEEVEEFFVCPLQNNWKGRYLGLYPSCGEDDDHARIWVLDQHPDEGVECQLRATDPLGISFSDSDWDVSANTTGISGARSPRR
jgi:hypothetical protein